ncbi:MAG TPA: hypothetical protein VFO39_13920 [Candidatus Sulfotelmatobacter sp.]|nr:hypothetical protein [Candidatus Sulfotelmatobacter sp.]
MSTLQTLLALVVLIYVQCMIVQIVQEFFKGRNKSKEKTWKATLDDFMGHHLNTDQVRTALQQRGLDITALEHFDKDDFRHLLDAIPGLEQQAQGILANAQATAEQLKDNIAAAFDAARAKFQTSYTKHNKTWVLIFSAAVVVILNANLIFLYQELAADQAMSQAIAATADRLAQSSSIPATQQGAGNSSTGNVCPKTLTSETSKDDFERSRKCINALVQEYPILVRWTKSDDKSTAWIWPQIYKDGSDSHRGWFETIAGLLVMWLLVSLGAPFWNDVLKGASGINAAFNNGKKRS